MIKKLLFFLALATTASHAQYTSPGTGITFGLAELVTASPSTVTSSGGIYNILQDITIAQADTFIVDETVEIHIAPDVLITIEGTFKAMGGAVFTAADITNPYEGFRFEGTSTGYLHGVTIMYGGGIRVLTANFEVDGCNISNHVSGAATGSAISFSTGSPIIKNSNFTNNSLPALSSGGNQFVSASIINNYFEGNNRLNSNSPQINMGPSGNDTIRIVGNVVKGDPVLTMVGGISASNLLGAGVNRVIIDNNIITDNRYGITVASGTSSGYIRGNIIENNNTQNIPLQGGSGIALSAAGPGMNIIASNNQIRGNLWGITLQGQSNINLGNTDPANYNPGGNVFANNSNGGVVYALYNNTPNQVFAMNNCWIEGTDPTAAEVENVISHQADTATLGEVIYTPFGCATASTPDFAALQTQIYPNPSNGNFIIKTHDSGNAAVYNLSGQLVLQKQLAAGENTVQGNLPPGMYIVKSTSGGKIYNDKLVIK